MSKLWRVKPLGTVVLELRGGASISAADFTDSGFPVLHKGSIQLGGRLDFERDGKIHTSEEFMKANQSAVVDDRFIVATFRNLVRTGETLGFVAPVPKGRAYLLAQGAYGLRLDPNILDSRYMAHLSNAWVFHREVLRRMVGTTQVHIRNGDFLAIPIALPPLVEQQRIAEILDKADALRVKRREALAQLDTLNHSMFLEMFGDPATNPLGFPIAKMGDVCDVRDGTHDSPKYVSEGGYPLVTSKNVTGGSVELTDVNYISEADYVQINKRSKVDRGDIILPMIGTIGSPVLVDHEPSYAIKNVALIKFTTTSPEATFVHHLLNGRYFDHIVSRKNRGGTQKFVSLGDLRDFPLPLPSSAQQREFARRIEAINKVRKAGRSADLNINALCASLQHQAFRGEL